MKVKGSVFRKRKTGEKLTILELFRSRSKNWCAYAAKEDGRIRPILLTELERSWTVVKPN